MFFFRFLTALLAQNQTYGSEATRAFAIHEIFMLKKVKIECFSIVDGPHDPK